MRAVPRAFLNGAALPGAVFIALAVAAPDIAMAATASPRVSDQLPISAPRAAETTVVSAQDDAGNNITLPRPARRIISLAPHATELLYAAGAGDRVIGVSDFSNYPAAATRVPSVGNFAAFDLERVLSLKPDLVVGWPGGNKPSQLARLRALGIPVFDSQPGDFATIAATLEKLSHLAGDDAAGQAAAESFRTRWRQLQAQYAGRAQVSVFYQIWSQPLMTLNGKHMVSSVLQLCGGRNIFADLPQLAPTVSIEAVLAADPQVILAPSDASDQPLARWREFPRLRAVRDRHLYSVNADWLNRPGPRILDAAAEVCQRLDEARPQAAR